MMLKTRKGEQYSYEFEKKDGERFYTNLHIIGKTIKLMKGGYSPIILICGGQRKGKSFVAVWIGYRILRYFFPEKEYDPMRYSIFDPLKSIYLADKLSYEPLTIDEAGAVFNKQEWYSRTIRAFDKIVQTQAYRCNCYIFVSPFGSDIAKTFRKHFDFIVYVRKRGVIKVKQVPKKYDDLTDKMPTPQSIEQIKIKKHCVPAKVWERYEEFSFKKKEEIAKNLLKEAKQHTVEYDFFGRPKI